MTLAARAERWAFIVTLLGMTAFLIADANPLLAVLAIVLAATGRSLARDPDATPDAPRGGVIPRWTLNALVVGALAYAALTAIQKPEDFVSSIGTLLCSLQVIRYFDRLEARDLRQALTMSLFTMVAAVLTSNSLLVGALLLVYTPAVAWALALRQLAVAHDQIARRLPETPPPAASPRLTRDTRRLVAVSTVFGAAFAALVFVTLPRNLGADMFGEWSSPSAGGGTTAGFTEKVQLGRSGELGESQETVLDLQLSDDRGRNIGAADRPVLLRGLVFDEYNPRTRARVRSDGASSGPAAITARTVLQTKLTQQRRGSPLVTQRITIRNKQSDYLFAIARPVTIICDREMTVLLGATDNVIKAEGRTGRLTYTVESQTDYAAAPDQARPERLPAMFRSGPIHDLADRTIRAAGYTRDPAQRFTENDLTIARILERFLRMDYSYSREMTPPQADEDPIEMFLLRTKQGHCEYFASAMAAMLRGLGIDARVVGGYRAAEYNEIAGQYTVRQSDAHSWVEAQVAPGLWMTFDPSPPDSVAASVKRAGGAIGAVRHLYDAAEQAWVSWVVGFDRQTRTVIFGVPKGNFDFMTARLESISRMPASRVAGRALRAALVGVVAFAVASILFFAAGALRRLLRTRSASKVAATRHDPASAAFERARETQARFYTRLLERLDRLGAGKPRWRAPMDHLASLEPALAPVAEHARALTRLYYELRFAPRLLSEAELAEAGTRLAALDDAARQANQQRPRTRGDARAVAPRRQARPRKRR